ncbi:MAG TPA: ATP-binding cassette domain-containing protein [Rhodocyclaceae bacterium]|nr:ATP-binding cassette domain-containing protein [Rhodocyclaceae bacterium]
MSRPPAVELSGIWTRYREVVVHRDVNLVVEAGDVVGLVGGSGSGKTTLLREILGLLKPSAGTVKLFGEVLDRLDILERRAVRQRMGMLFQHGALFSALSVYDNIAFPLRELKGLDEDWIRQLVHLKLEMVELELHHGRLMPSELSGGMVKRVALARALALEPELLLLDEPTAGLDPDRSETFVRLIRQLQRELGFSVVMVTHDLDTLAGLSSKMAVLADQHIVAYGTPAEVMAVDHPFIQNFFCCERGLAALTKANS